MRRRRFREADSFGNPSKELRSMRAPEYHFEDKEYVAVVKTSDPDYPFELQVEVPSVEDVRGHRLKMTREGAEYLSRAFREVTT